MRTKLPPVDSPGEIPDEGRVWFCFGMYRQMGRELEWHRRRGSKSRRMGKRMAALVARRLELLVDLAQVNCAAAPGLCDYWGRVGEYHHMGAEINWHKCG